MVMKFDLYAVLMIKGPLPTLMHRTLRTHPANFMLHKKLLIVVKGFSKGLVSD